MKGRPVQTPFRWPLGFAALFSVSLAIILAGQIWRNSPIEMAWAWPVLGGWTGWTWLAPVLALSTGMTAATFMWFGWRRARKAGVIRAWAALVCYYGAIFFYIWFLLPASDVGMVHWLFAGVFLVAAAWLLRVRARSPIIWKGTWCAAPYLYLDLLVVALPAAAWVYLREPVNFGSAAISVVTYPIYALIQLIALLVLPAVLLQQLGLKRRGTAFVCASMFALIHWPNPVVMAATFVAMGLWSMAHLAGRGLLVSALVMGVAATSFTQFMPVAWTEHMRVGPGMVRLRAVERLGGPDPAASHGFEANVIEPGDFLREIYPPILGREATPTEIEIWRAALLRGLRCDTVCFMTTGPEYRVLADQGLVMAPPPAGIHWTKTPPAWRQHMEELCSLDYWNAHGANVDDFYRAVWSESFLKPYPMASAPYISDRLSPAQCRRLVEVLHENRRQWRPRPLGSIADEDLLWVRN